uniref:Polyhedrin n=1 Tax=Lutzomyia reovirus 2 TaxID=1670670 RepID=A0A0H4M992_9REOV|nr:polyhedrin [Lutzomyia reovirus 2]
MGNDRVNNQHVHNERINHQFKNKGTYIEMYLNLYYPDGGQKIWYASNNISISEMFTWKELTERKGEGQEVEFERTNGMLTDNGGGGRTNFSVYEPTEFQVIINGAVDLNTVEFAVRDAWGATNRYPSIDHNRHLHFRIGQRMRKIGDHTWSYSGTFKHPYGKGQSADEFGNYRHPTVTVKCRRANIGAFNDYSIEQIADVYMNRNDRVKQEAFFKDEDVAVENIYHYRAIPYITRSGMFVGTINEFVY